MIKSKETFEGFTVWTEPKGYKVIWLGGKAIKLHVYIWERENGPKPDGHDIHHKDFDKGNFALSNLELLSKSDHQKVHARWIKTGDVWTHKPCTACGLILPLTDYYKRKGLTPHPKCKSCHCKVTRKWAISNPEKRKAIANSWYHRNKNIKEVEDGK